MRILIVEDKVKIAKALKQGLQQESYAVDICYDGEEGYDYAVSEDYDVIILDLMLPKLSGTEICKKLRKDKVNTPILMLTAKSQVEDKVDGLNIGADDYLTKPFAFEELLARIKALLRRPNQLNSDILECDDLKVNLQTFEVSRANKPITLSKKEFALLEYLIRNKNTTLSKDKIIEHVWSFDADVLPNTVEVYIGYLRNKIDKPFKNSPKLINTIRGFGYVLKCA